MSISEAVPRLGWRWQSNRWEYRVSYEAHPNYWCIAGTITPTKAATFRWVRSDNPARGVLPGSGESESFTEAREAIEIPYEYEVVYAG